MGPHTFNFADAAERSLAAGASLRVADLGEGVDRAVALTRDAQRDNWVQCSLDFAAAHRGAAERIAAAVLALADARAATAGARSSG
jgi:3-deoxy-D-manno-octulosonic-acid transferase